jgi:hypothetical protein
MNSKNEKYSSISQKSLGILLAYRLSRTKEAKINVALLPNSRKQRMPDSDRNVWELGMVQRCTNLSCELREVIDH